MTGSAARVVLFNVALFTWMGVMVPYFPGWLASRGVSAAETGVLLGITPWLRLLLNPALGQRTDQRGGASGTLFVLSIAAACGLVLYEATHSFSLYVVAALLVSAAFAPMVSLVDGVALRCAAAGELSYAPVRSAGSIAFIVGVTCGGALVGAYGYAWIPLALAGLTALIAVAALLLPKHAPAATGAGAIVPARARAVLARPGVLRFLIGCTLIQASHAMVYNFGTLHWQSIGVAPELIGWLWSVGIFVEVGVFLAGERILRRITPGQLMTAAGAAGAIRWCVLGATSDITLLFAAQTLHAVSFSALHLGAMGFITRRIPEQHTMTGLYTAAGGGVGMGLAIPFFGWAFGVMHGSAFFLAAVMAAIGALVLLTLEQKADSATISASRDASEA